MPQVTAIHISILPDISTQQLEFQSGQLQMIIHGLSKEDEAAYEHNPKYQLIRFPANFKLMLAVNEHKGIFSEPRLAPGPAAGHQPGGDRQRRLRPGRHRLHPDLSGRRAARQPGGPEPDV